MSKHKNKITRELAGKTFYRSIQILKEDADVEKREIKMSFSSEQPYLRDYGYEILDHNSGAMRMDRLKAGAALLINHNRDQHVGAVVSAGIEDSKGRAVVRFSRSSMGEDAFNDVLDGIRSNTSVGYVIYDMKDTGRLIDGVRCFRAIDWEPIEITLASIPADPTVGVGRTMENKKEEPEDIADEFCDDPECCGEDCEDYDKCMSDKKAMKPEKPKEEDKKMENEIQVKERVDKEVEEALKRRENEIIQMRATAKQFDCEELLEEGLKGRMAPEDFNKKILEKMASKPFNPEPELGMSRKEVKSWNLMRAIDATLKGSWKEAGFEREVNETLEKKLGPISRGEGRSFRMPYEVAMYQQRAGAGDSVSVSADGASLIQETLDVSSYIDILRKQPFVKRAGAKVLSGLTDSIMIPRLATGNTISWISTENSQTASNLPGFDNIELKPKHMAAINVTTRNIILQALRGSMDLNNLLMEDMFKQMAVAQDTACISGSGVSGQPKGLYSITSVQAPTISSASAPTWAEIVSFPTALAKKDVLEDSTWAWATTGKGRGYFMGTPKIGTTFPIFFCDGKTMIDYPVFMSNTVTDTLGTGSNQTGLIFGAWSQMIIGEWNSAFDVIVDPYTYADYGQIRLVTYMSMDLNVRHPEAFAIGKLTLN
jgi:HK97 family phage major capsid protein